MVKFVSVVLVFCALTACSKDKTASSIEKEMFTLAKDVQNHTWYKFSDSILPVSSGSAHGTPFLRTRFNNTAANQLDANGNIKENAVFDEGSFIVKELINSDQTLFRYAILYKKSDSPEADDRGWVWGYINADGSVAEPASNKGGVCINCHLQTGNVDYMLMPVYFP